MKSFLREIESKFIELHEQKSPEEAEKLTSALNKLTQAQNQYNASLSTTANLTPEGYTDDANDDKISDADGMPLNDNHNCERDHPGMTHKEFEDKESNEASTTGGVPGFQTPASFAKRGKWKNKNAKYETVQEAMDRKYERLIESYRQFSRGDKKMTPENKVKRTIQEVSKKLKEIETLVKHTSKLKEDSGMSRVEYGPRTEKALNKISEKLIKIAERVRAIGE
jgi:hypothetical protein